MAPEPVARAGAQEPKAYLSARERLLSMPDVFSLPSLAAHQGWSRQQASVYVAGWAEKGLVDMAGPSSGCYFNRVRNPEGVEHLRSALLELLYPSAVLTGESVLHAAGWTTQIPQRMAVCVLSRQSLKQIDGFDLRTRPRRWFEAVHDAVASEERVYGLRALPPALALWDLHADRSGKVWQPDADDLDLAPDELRQVAALPPSMLASLPEPIREIVSPYVPSSVRSGARSARRSGTP